MEERLNVLIAEDEFIVARNIKQQVQNLGYNVVGMASNEEQVLKAIASCKIDLILMDVMLQGPIDGIEIAKRVKATQPISFVFITAYSSDEYVDRARLVEPHGYLLKPFSNRDLTINIELAAYKHKIEQGLREAKMQLESLNLRLEEKVSLRTAGLKEANRQLMLEIKMRKHNEDKLRDSEQKYKELTEFLPIPVIETNKYLEITYANVATRELFDINESKYFHQLSDLFPSNEKVHLDEAIRRCKEAESLVSEEFSGSKRNSIESLSLIAYFTPIVIESKFSGVRVAFLDISQRVAAENQLRVLSLAIEQAKDCIMITDKESKIEYVNNAATREYGYSYDELIHSTPKIFRSRFHDDSFYTHLWQTISSGNSFSSVFVNKRKNDELFYEEKTISPVKDKNGDIRNYISTGRNITEKIKAEQKAIENQNLINSINNSVPIIIFIFDLIQQKVIFVNNQILSMLGYSQDEVCNATFADIQNYFIDLKEIPISTALTKTDFKNGYQEEVVRVKHKHHGLNWLNVRFAEFKSDETGRITEIIGSAIDVTEQKQSERKLGAMMRLNRMQDKRTQKIRTLSLIQGQEDERRRISRDIHDGIGQMLTALKLNIENFDRPDSLTENEQIKYCRVNELIKETIAEVRRISNALAPPGLYDFGLYSVTKQLLEQLSTHAGIVIHFDSNIQSLRYSAVVEVTLYRIIQESINNALKHSRAKNIRLSINQDNEGLQLLISDDGIGLKYSKEELEHMKFSGKGLKNIKERAILIGAELKLVSKPKKGCTVNIRVPIKNCIQ
jgi:PAS domain S-box-containing protein